MDSLLFYWALTLIVLIILILISDVGTAAIITTMLIIVKSITSTEHIDTFTSDEPEHINTTSNNHHTDNVSPPVPIPASVKQLNPSVMKDNENMLEDVLNPKQYSADDKIFNASIVSGYKNKKAKEIRSHWNNKNWKRYYDYEFGIHETENREWWADDDFELSKKHVVI